MKKSLLAILFASLSFGAFAQDDEYMDFNDMFTITYDGDEVTASTPVLATHIIENSDGTLNYSMDLDVENHDIDPSGLRAVLSPYNPDGKTYLANKDFWGEVQLCYMSKAAGATSGNCLSGNINHPIAPNFGAGNLIVPVSNGSNEFKLQIHVNNAAAEADASYLLKLQGIYDDAGTIYYLTNPVSLILNFKSVSLNIDETLISSPQEGEYYDLQGRRIKNPSKGIYIYRTSDKAIKRIIK